MDAMAWGDGLRITNVVRRSLSRRYYQRFVLASTSLASW